MEKEIFQVIASVVSKIYIHYECPRCFTKYIKDGITPRKGAKHIRHSHGSNGNLGNRTEIKSDHCINHSGNVHIIIDDTTRRE